MIFLLYILAHPPTVFVSLLTATLQNFRNYSLTLRYLFIVQGSGCQLIMLYT